MEYANAASIPSAVTPPAAPAWGHFVDSYKNNISANKTGSSNLATLGNGNIRISIPFTPAQGEDYNAIVGLYMDNSGKSNAIAKSGYNQNIRSVTLITDHLGKYVVGYNKVDFSDISSHWGNSYITFLAAHNIISGTGDNLFSPNKPVTRAEFAKMLAGIANADVSVYTTSAFTDVKAGTWYLPYVTWAAENSIVNGAGNNQFNPQGGATRAEAAKILTVLLQGMIQ